MLYIANQDRSPMEANPITIIPPENRELSAQKHRSRVMRRAALLGVLFGLGFGMLRDVAEHQDISSWLKVAFIVLFALTLALCFTNMDSAYLDVPDELDQKIRGDAARVALPAFVAAVFTLGALDLAGLPLLKTEHYWLPLIVIYALAGFWAKRRYS